MADLCTRGTAKVEDVMPGSLWQSGPHFLVLGRDQWPVTRNFVRTDLPVEEIKSGVKLIAACLRAKADVTIGVVKSTISTKPKSSGGEHSNQERQAESIEDVLGKPSETIELFEKLLLYDNNLQSRIRVVAIRVL